MQTFLPVSDFAQSAQILDYRRLGNQRVECKQILTAILDPTPGRGWVNHPATRMWRPYPVALAHYMQACIDEWIRRGYKNTMIVPSIPYSESNSSSPSWLGRDDLHASHRSNLLRKDFEYYSRYGWSEPTDLEYVWPL